VTRPLAASPSTARPSPSSPAVRTGSTHSCKTSKPPTAPPWPWRPIGRIDILINNAGLMLLGPIAGADVDEWERMIAVNQKGLL
jgi:NAD(P)-dependent dehydrogenase (short-subunit alcohol dehydrogenase family)